MRKGGTVHWGCCPLQSWRSYLCKAVILMLITFLVLEYATNLLVYKEPFNKMVAPGLAWITQSLNQKLSSKNKLVIENATPKNVNLTISVNNTLAKRLINVTKSVDLVRIKTEKEQPTLDHKSTSHNVSLEMCPLVPPALVGRLKVLTNAPSFDELEKFFTKLEPGGRFKPASCISRNKVAVIIPYRDREEHLRIFLHNLHPIMQRQQLDYGIYVIEEAPDIRFNRAMLMNIGYVEACKQYDYDCFIFHDVDLIPEDDRNLYTCPEQPRHMSVAVDTMNYRLPYKDIFGGVSALSKKHMEAVNGFSNEFWGWGAEDDDMSNRLRHHGFKITRYSPKIARYTMLKHKKDDPNPDRYNKLYRGKHRYGKDGLSNLKYNRIDLVYKKIYTWVLVEIEPIKP